MLNGAFFNRIGSRIAEQPYLKSIISALCSLTGNNLPISTIEIKYSKRFVPNNLPPENGNNLSFINESVHMYNDSFLLHKLKLYVIAVSIIFPAQLNEKLSKPFKNDLLRPPSQYVLFFLSSDFQR